MLSTCMEFRIILGLSLIIIILPLRNCAFIKTVQHHDNDDWLRWVLPKLEPTSRPDVDDAWFRWTPPTWKPFTWKPPEPATRPDDSWFRWTIPTWKPFTWPTLRPDVVHDYRESRSSGINGPLILTILIPIIVLVLCTTLLIRRGNCCDFSSTYTATSTAQLLPRSSTIPPSSTNSNTAYSPISWSVFARESLVHPFNVAPSTNSTTIPYSDRPPDYTSVILDDLTEKAKFPEVKSSKEHDMPPPYNF